MKKKSKLASYLSLAFLGIASLTTACSSGSGANNSGASTTPPAEQPPITFVNTPTDFDVEAFVVKFATDHLESYVANYIATDLFNKIVSGSANPEDYEDVIYSNLLTMSNQLASVESGFKTQDTLINQLIGIINSNTLDYNQNNLYNLNYQLQQNLKNIGTTLIYSPLYPKYGDSISRHEESVFTGYDQGKISESMMKLVLKNLSSNSVYITDYLNWSSAGSGLSLDLAQQTLSCDFGAIPWYTESKGVNETNHPIPNINNVSCLFSNTLNDLTAQLLLQNRGNSSGVNSFYYLYQLNMALADIYLRTLSALTQAYQMDQFKLYVMAKESSSQQYITLPVVVSPPKGGVLDYNVASSEIEKAYNHRVKMLASLFRQTEKKAFDSYASAINSTNMAENCNLSVESLNKLSLTSSLSATASNVESNNGNLLSWDGQYLAVTCHNAQRYESGIFTSTTDVTDMCQPTSSPANYNLNTINGYVYCGTMNSNIKSQESVPLGINSLNYYSMNSATPVSGPLFKLSNSGSASYSYDPTVYVYPYDYPGRINTGYDYYGNITLTVNFSQPLKWFANPLQTWVTGYESTTGLKLNNGGPATDYSQIWTATGESVANWTKLTVVSPMDGGFAEFTPSFDSNSWFLVNDGVHTFLMGAFLGYQNPSGLADYNPTGAIYLQCLANDINCVQGVFANPNEQSEGAEGSSDYLSLVFSNGDTITLTQSGRMTQSGSYAGLYGTGNYTLTQHYGSDCSAQTIINQPVWQSTNCTVAGTGNCMTSPVSFAGYSGQNMCSNN